MGILEIEEVRIRTRELERMFPGLREAWEAAWESDYNWKDVASDYEAYRTFSLLVEATTE